MKLAQPVPLGFPDYEVIPVHQAGRDHRVSVENQDNLELQEEMVPQVQQVLEEVPAHKGYKVNVAPRECQAKKARKVPKGKEVNQELQEREEKLVQ